MNRLLPISALGLAAVIGGAALYVTMASGPDDPLAQCRATTIAGGGADIGGPFTLTSETGEQVTEADVITGPTLIYFGYSYCPDICPVDLQRNAEAIYLMEDAGDTSVTPVFITIDPQRDTPQQLLEYTDFMHPRMLGLTGTQAQIDDVTAAYRAYARKVGDDPENYLMDHSGFTYLMAPDVGLVDVFSRDTSPQEMSETLSCYADAL